MCFFEVRVHCWAMADLELALYIRLALNLQRSTCKDQFRTVSNIHGMSDVHRMGEKLQSCALYMQETVSREVWVSWIPIHAHTCTHSPGLIMPLPCADSPSTPRPKEACLLCWAQVTWSPSQSYRSQLRAFWSFWKQPSSSHGSRSRWCDEKINESGTLVQGELDGKALWMLIHFVHAAWAEAGKIHFYVKMISSSTQLPCLGYVVSLA